MYVRCKSYLFQHSNHLLLPLAPCKGSLWIWSKTFVLPPPLKNLKRPEVWAPLVAFLSSPTFCSARCKMMLYKISTRKTGRIPITVVSRTKCGGARTMNQQIRPLSVSPRQPIAGRKPTTSPRNGNIYLHYLAVVDYLGLDYQLFKLLETVWIFWHVNNAYN